MRERDIDDKDKQNFSAVMKIIRASPVLDQIPDAVATKQYINTSQWIVDSFLNTDLDPFSRVEKIWNSLFFLRYWRQLILAHPQYTLKYNLIVRNAYNVH